MRQTGDTDDVRRMPAARAFGVIGVDRAVGDGRNRILDKSRFVERVGVDGHLNVVAVSYTETAVDGRGRRAPILMQLEPARPRLDLLFQRPRQTAVALTQETEVDGKRLGRLKHALDIPCPWGAGGRVPAGGR